MASMAEGLCSTAESRSLSREMLQWSLEASCSTTHAFRYRKELKEVLAKHGHRNSPVRNPQFPSFHEADTQSLF
jgi:hypothetical protein